MKSAIVKWLVCLCNRNRKRKFRFLNRVLTVRSFLEATGDERGSRESASIGERRGKFIYKLVLRCTRTLASCDSFLPRFSIVQTGFAREENESGFSNRFQEKKRRKRKRERNYSHYRCIRHEISKLIWWWIVGIYWTMNLRIWLHILIGIDNWWLMKRNVIVDVSIYKIYKDTRIFCENIIEIYYSN